MVCAQKNGAWESFSFCSLLAVRHMRREHIRTMSKNADNEHLLEEWSTLHPCFINIFAVICCCVLLEKDVFTLSPGVSVCQASFPLVLSQLGILQLTVFWHARFCFLGAQEG